MALAPEMFEHLDRLDTRSEGYARLLLVEPPVLDIWVGGQPRPKGSGKAIPNAHGGKPIWVAGDKRAEEWQRTIRRTCDTDYAGALLRVAVIVSCEFHDVRPANHYGTGRNAGVLKVSAPRHKTTAPDVDKTARACLDGLIGKVIADDALVCALLSVKVFGEENGVRVRVWMSE